MTSIILVKLASFCTGVSDYIKANCPFVIEGLMVSLCFGAILSKYAIIMYK
ncbi:hypothetical protein KR222_002669 [Zaprionus bogoriensis]|nr:hypothetical protein KR222_002669 [Zaprionus bogoriensis]